MVRRAFPAEVTNGQLRFQESLADLEGQRVIVVLDECESPSKQWPRLTPTIPPIDEMDIEKDVSFRIPFRHDIDSDVMLDPWCELPRPPVIGRVTPKRVEQLPFDIPRIPTEEDVE